MREKKTPSHSAAEPTAASTYGMSQELRNSDLLWRIRNLDINDKVCLLEYIQNEMEESICEDDCPYSKEELDTRYTEIAEDIADGSYLSKKEKFLTSTEANVQLHNELPWLM